MLPDPLPRLCGNGLGNNFGDRETVNRLTDILVTMNTPTDRGKLFKLIKMLYGLMGLQFSEEAGAYEHNSRRFRVFHFFVHSGFWRNHSGNDRPERMKQNTDPHSGVSSLPTGRKETPLFFMP